MLLPLTPNQSQIQEVLVSFLESVLPSGGAVFTAKIAGGVMTVGKMITGTIGAGDNVLGNGVARGTVITAVGPDGIGTYSVSPAQSVSVVQTMSTGVDVYEGQDNRVSESQFPDQVVFTPMRRARLATNIDEYEDALFVGSIAGATMTIEEVVTGYTGQIGVGSSIFGPGLAPNTVVTALGTGTGGAGTYQVSPAQTASSGFLAAGIQTIMQETEIVFQLDVHGPNSGDNAQIISTMFRDAYGVSQFAKSGLPVTPLYADDPSQRPFTNENNQVENRWVIDAHLQADQTVTIPQQYSALISAIAISVEAPPYPP